MRFGVGQWLAILNTGLLPGKMIQQLNGQTQRLLGQQSLAAYSGLKVDVDRIRADNEKRTAVLRKSGLIIYQGPTPSKEAKQQWQREAKEKCAHPCLRLRRCLVPALAPARGARRWGQHPPSMLTHFLAPTNHHHSHTHPLCTRPPAGTGWAPRRCTPWSWSWRSCRGGW